jgi:methylphosphotriester-DNA--protein-cysteine methyltransferase
MAALPRLVAVETSGDKLNRCPLVPVVCSAATANSLTVERLAASGNRRSVVLRPIRATALRFGGTTRGARRCPQKEVNMNPRHHTQKMQKALGEIRDHLRKDIEEVDEPQLKAMFETSAEVLNGLIKAFGDYEKKNEAAWQ